MLPSPNISQAKQNVRGLRSKSEKRPGADRTLFAPCTLANAPERSKYSKCCTSVYSSKTWCNSCANLRKSPQRRAPRHAPREREDRASRNPACCSNHRSLSSRGALWAQQASEMRAGTRRGICFRREPPFTNYRARASSPSKALRAARSPPKAAQILPEHCPPSARASPRKCARLRSSWSV
jgi:hypothetical protein